MKPLKILIVEDEPKIREYLAVKLKEFCPACDIAGLAADGYEALAFLGKSIPHVVIADIRMPKMDGIELAKHIQVHYPNVFVVILSGYSDFSLAQQAIECGVYKYLLKPFQDEQLKELLGELQYKMTEVIFRDVNPPPLPKSYGHHDSRFFLQLQENKCILLLLCVQNLCCSQSDMALHKAYEDIMHAVNWESLVQSTSLADETWIMLQQKQVNQVAILVIAPEAWQRDAAAIAAELFETFSAQNGPLFLNIGCHKSPFHYREMALYAHRLRNMLEQNVMPLRPAIYVLERDELVKESVLADVAKKRANQLIKNYQQQMNASRSAEEMHEIFHFMLENALPQLTIVRICTTLFSLFHFSQSNQGESQAQTITSGFFQTLGLSCSIRDIERRFADCIEQLLNFQHKQGKAPPEVVAYVNEHAFTIKSMEQIAEHFSYNYTYLSRMFKKETGVSLTKYIANRRIETAKELLAGQPDLGVGQVALMVGYEDQHHFSKLFRSMCRMSPTEYREKTHNSGAS